MKVKLDENLPAELVIDLIKAGHEAHSVVGQGMRGAADELLLQHVQSAGEAFLTLDKGIADVRAYPPQDYAGIVLFRPPSPGRLATLDFVRRFLPDVFDAIEPGRLIVVAPAGLRIR